jgi:Na+-transporting methylmalonyl-CoA/oxaloacetate decarboxylase gamma subunit
VGHIPRALGVAAVFASAVLLATTVTGCGKAVSTGKASASPHPVAKPATCAQLYARLQQVTVAIDASSELIASSQNPQQLSQRIAAEEKALSQSAEFMSAVQAPAALAPADRQLVTALWAFSADFARAKGPAARGDFQAAVTAMGDKTVVQKIVAASGAIEKACK